MAIVKSIAFFLNPKPRTQASEGVQHSVSASLRPLSVGFDVAMTSVS